MTDVFDTQPVKVITTLSGDYAGTAPDVETALDPADEPRGGTNWLKWSLGCVGLLMTLLSGGVLAGLILFPIAFRSLDGYTRQNIIERIPFVGTFQPTRVYQALTLPTAQAVNADAVAALLDTETPIPIPSATPTLEPTSLLSTITPTPLFAQPGVAVAVDVTSPPPPSPTTLPTQLPTIPPTATEKPLPSSARIDGIKRVYQTLNDCGPANLTQALQFYGWSGNENDARVAIKPSYEDHNVSPWELVDFVRKKTGVKAIARVAGDMKLIKRLVSSKFVVMLETGYILPDDWAGHYLTVLGYDDNQGIIYGGDTNLGFGPDGLGQREEYADLDKRWEAFNRMYIVVFPRERESELAAILGANADPNENLKNALEISKEALRKNKDNPFAYFNLGSVYTQLGDFKRATAAFDQARNTGAQLPWRMLWYQFTPFEAYYRVGNFAEVKSLANITLANAPIEEARYWRGMAAAAMGDSKTAMDDFKYVMKFNPNFTAAAEALSKVQNGTFQAPAKVSAP